MNTMFCATESLILFARPPAPGRVKTRLIPELGDVGAACLYRAFLSDAAAMACAVRRARPTVALTAEWAFENDRPEEFSFGDWLPGPFLHRAQSGADIGQRMAAAMGRRLASGGRAVLMGTDFPDLPAEIPIEAFETLNRMENRGAVLGPAADGGYYLIGLNRPAPEVFSVPEWGMRGVFEATRKILTDRGFRIHLLPVWQDVDEPEDLAALRERLAASGAAPHTRAALIE